SQGEKTHKVDHGGKKKEQKADFVRFYRCDYRKPGTFSVASNQCPPYTTMPTWLLKQPGGHYKGVKGVKEWGRCRDGTPVPSASGLHLTLPFVEADGIGMPSLPQLAWQFMLPYISTTKKATS
ncbi:MAG: hypothetical protein IJ613_07385, partial [Muribaculaceae bacterium]|nr:hypothetical protein [Muribaculaceae bacterium]